MKKLLALCLLYTSFAAAFAAAPVVVIDDNFNAIVDGSNFGKAGDAIVNHKTNAELVVAVNLAIMAKFTALKTAADASVAAAQAQRDSAIAAKTAAETASGAETAKTAAIIAALKGVNQATLPTAVKAELLTAAAKEKANLQAQKAALEAKLAEVP